LNEKIQEKLGGTHSCKSLLYSVDFAEIEALQYAGRWDKLDEIMADAAAALEKAGADGIILCANTMHLCASAIQKRVSIPFLHIAAATGEKIVEKKLKKVGLLGTKFTMEKDFYKDFIKENFDVTVIVPEESDRIIVSDIIYKELIFGNCKENSKKAYQKVIEKLKNNGAEGVILGCTEIPLLIEAGDVDIPVFNTTEIHAEKAVTWALNHV
jgi:aspartate racemase